MADPWGICQRCGWKYRLSAIRKEWTNLRVCPSCWDPRPKQLTAPKIGPEGQPLPNSAPQPTDIFLTDNEVTPDDL